MSEELYQRIKQTENISQGDIFLNFPILLPDKETNYEELKEITPQALKENIQYKVYETNIIILSQSCDMVYDESRGRYPVDPVIVASINDISQYSWNLVGETNSGKRPAYFLLNKSDGFLDMSYIIDFGTIFTIPYDLLNRFSKGYGERYRPTSPILEKISQHFGNYFSRIGLEYERDSKDLKAEYQTLKSSPAS
ncbi:hypothetical protein P4607_22980 [Priestia megaterium]|uniref:hypothetical protein n=1 Tax=Priestia megaterium TaxID=1404 RepID=UPI002E24C76C|nr:hypothetical protein [Priestia megaterium]